MSLAFGPLKLIPIFLPKVWAESRFPEPWAASLGVPLGTGEVWLASDRLHVTQVAAGPLVGMGLDQVVAQWPEYVLGPGAAPGFPLLLKLLNVGQWLSVQVHPDDAIAARLENEPWGKNESWHVLHAQTGAQLVHGLTPGTTTGQVAQAAAQGRLPDILAKVPAQTGDTFDVPAGTLHTTGPGLLILEVQQASDLTYRLYDWERPGPDGKPRPLHLEQAMEALKPSGPGKPLPPSFISPPPWKVISLVRTHSFGLLKYVIMGKGGLEKPGGGPGLLWVEQGKGRLEFPGGEHPAEELRPGQCWLLPAGCAPAQVAARDNMTFYQAWAPGPGDMP
ncbi:MAG: class I mannose-6-phosphate isomerase [Deltaproteobacteria bacterium]|nr:class I mannose-6-phosphate isomerase [Deltaproteobacteria bacterium]